jgi:TonB family protein
MYFLENAGQSHPRAIPSADGFAVEPSVLAAYEHATPTPLTRMPRIALLVSMSAACALASLPPPEEGPFDRKPEVIRATQEDPVYPYSLGRSGFKGEVEVDFIIDREGNVVHTDVFKSTHPDFEAPAVEAVLKWKFKPGIKNGHPVYVHMRVPIFFTMNPNRQFPDHPNGYDVWARPGKASKNLPPEFQYDEGPKPILTTAPVYPYELLRAKTTGQASVRFTVDPIGRTHVIKIEEASLPEFGEATAAMISSWRFEPATKGGVPCWALIIKKQEFNGSDTDFPVNESEERLLKVLRKTPSTIISNAHELDEELKGRFQPSPIVPDSVMKANVPARAVIEFVVDHAGHAQLPQIVSATDPSFGWAAATAVARWQFTQPMRNGKPADVTVEVPVVYSPPAKQG